MIFPSEANTKIKPSKVCNKWDPSSLRSSGRLLIDGLQPHPSPRPKLKVKLNFFGTFYSGKQILKRNIDRSERFLTYLQEIFASFVNNLLSI